MLSGSGILSQKFWEKEKVNFLEKVFDLYMMPNGWGGGVLRGAKPAPLVKIFCK